MAHKCLRTLALEYNISYMDYTKRAYRTETSQNACLAISHDSSVASLILTTEKGRKERRYKERM
jgi:hypothetical protein